MLNVYRHRLNLYKLKRKQPEIVINSIMLMHLSSRKKEHEENNLIESRYTGDLLMDFVISKRKQKLDE